MVEKLLTNWLSLCMYKYLRVSIEVWVKVFRIIPDFRIFKMLINPCPADSLSAPVCLKIKKFTSLSLFHDSDVNFF